jgi:hypothetical protein
MGATQNEGMPLDLFSSGEPRWLGAQFNRPGEAEQPRVLLTSVPYALKASDAETLGGRPASAYLLAGTPTGVGATTGVTAASSTTATTPMMSNKATAPVNSGIPNYIAMFTNSIDVGDSVMYQANGAIGVGTTQPGISLDVRTGSLPQIGVAGVTDYLTMFASDTYGPAMYWDPAQDLRFGKGGTGLYNPYGFAELMRIQSSTGNVGIGTVAPASKLDVRGDINFSGVVRYQGSPILQAPNSSVNSGNHVSNNLAVGIGVMQNNISGSANTATGYQAMLNNTSGSENTAIGFEAMENNTTGNLNTAVGMVAMVSNTTGASNTAIGLQAMGNSSTGNSNTAVGQKALGRNQTGSNNTAVGIDAGIGVLTGSNNIAIGNAAGILVNDASNNIHIGNQGASTDSGVIRIGDVQTSFFVAGVNGVTTTNSAVPVLIDTTNGQLGIASSSRRFKEDIEDMGTASSDLMRLRPVTYRYKQPFADGSKPVQYGLIAEEVAEVYPDLVAHSTDGQIVTVKYQVLDSMLLNEIQRLERENQDLHERLAKLEAALSSQSDVAKASRVH